MTSPIRAFPKPKLILEYEKGAAVGLFLNEIQTGRLNSSDLRHVLFVFVIIF